MATFILTLINSWKLLNLLLIELRYANVDLQDSLYEGFLTPDRNFENMRGGYF